MMSSPFHIICPHRLCNFVPSSCSPYTFCSSDIPLQTPIPKHLGLILVVIITANQVMRVVNTNEIVDNRKSGNKLSLNLDFIFLRNNEDFESLLEDAENAFDNV